MKLNGQTKIFLRTCKPHASWQTMWPFKAPCKHFTHVSYSCRKVANWGTPNLPNLLRLMVKWVRLLHMQEICSSNSPVITEIYDPNKSRA